MSKKITVSKAIGEALHEEMLRDDKVFLIGEDMAVMGNVFAITKGFLDEFGPNRVIDTPISEASDRLSSLCTMISQRNAQIRCLIRRQKCDI